MSGMAVVFLMSVGTAVAFVIEAHPGFSSNIWKICAGLTLLVICSELAERFA